jgi:hypothetical protein
MGRRAEDGGFGLEQANLFELASRSIQVTFSSTSITGRPLLSYRDHNLQLNFEGEEIDIRDTQIGQLITVTLETIPDLRTVTFTLILPLVNVIRQSGGIRVSVSGIRTTTHTTIVGPGLGAEKTYAIVTLEGTAQFVDF